MAFVIEDGTGIQDANAYVDISFVEGYLMGKRLAQFTAMSDSEKEAAIIAGSQLVDISYDWLGSRKTLEQGLSWPRLDVEFDGFAVEGVPAAVKKATCEAVWLSMTEESLFSNENNREVARERIEGAVDISYVSPKDKAKETVTRFEILDKLVKHFIRKTETQSDGGGSSLGSAQVERV
jgi:hypothetical protein